MAAKIKKTKKIWMDGKFVRWENAKVHFLTHALHYGSGVFEGIRAYKTFDNGYAIFRLREHLKRFLHSARTLEMSMPYAERELFDAVVKTVKVNRKAYGKADSAYIRPLLYYGYGKMGVDPTGAVENLGIATFPLGAYLGRNAQKEGIRATVSDVRRLFTNPEIAHAKICGHYSNSILAKHDAHRKGFDEAVMLDRNGNVAECSAENIFMVKNNRLITPPKGSILVGVTRDSIIKFAHDFGITTKERFFKPRRLYAADEVFVCGTAAEITPVRQVDEYTIGSGTTGPITDILQKTYFAIVRGELEKYKHWLTYVK